jgi:hypothetical protein
MRATIAAKIEAVRLDPSGAIRRQHRDAIRSARAEQLRRSHATWLAARPTSRRTLQRIARRFEQAASPAAQRKLSRAISASMDRLTTFLGGAV